MYYFTKQPAVLKPDRYDAEHGAVLKKVQKETIHTVLNSYSTCT